MTYKILLVDDGNATTIRQSLQEFSEFRVDVHSPTTLESSLLYIQNGGYDLIVIDFRLTSRGNRFDAPTLAQCLRTPGSETFLRKPIVLISSERNITSFYKGMVSQQLFDYSLSKENYLDRASYYNELFFALIQAYDKIASEQFKIEKIMNIPSHIKLPESIYSTLTSPIYMKNVHAYCFFILNELIRSIGVLIGEDVLSARLGVSKASTDWEKLKAKLSTIRYTGIFSDVYPRWWADGLDVWWEQFTHKNDLKRLSAKERVEKLKNLTTYTGLVDIGLPASAKSSHFWTICRATKVPLDPLEGFEISGYNNFPWQEQAFVSFDAALQSHEKYRTRATREAKKRFREQEKIRRGVCHES